MNSGRITCLVNVRNGEPFLASTLDSLVSQRPRCEIVVVDNQSTDATAIIARSFPQVRHLMTPGPIPLGAARTYGLSVVETDYVAWVDGDDLWATSASGAYHEAFKRYPGAVLFSAGTTTIDHSGNALPRKKQRWFELEGERSYLPGETVERLVRTTNPRSAWCSYVFRTQTVREVGGFDPKLTFSEDFDLIGKVVLRGEAIHLPRNLAMYRVHASQSTQRMDPKARYDEAYLVASRLAREAKLMDDNALRRLRHVLDFKCDVSRLQQHFSLSALGDVFRDLASPGVVPWLFERLRASCSVRQDSPA